jgi:iron complex transport system ATP-binding protein
MTTLLECEQLVVTLNDKKIIGGLNLSINQGDYLGIVGPNGAGKSTLLKALLRIAPVSGGQILLGGQAIENVNHKKLAEFISYVPQSQHNQLGFSVYDFLKMSRYRFHTMLSDWSTSDTNAIESAIAITEIEPFIDQAIDTLSGGERQRVMIAAALAQESQMMLLDEPTSFLDPHHQVEVHQLVKRLNEQHQLTIIEVTHDINHASQHCKHILALKQGKQHWYGEASQFLEQSRLQALYQQSFVFVTHPQTNATIALADEHHA